MPGVAAERGEFFWGAAGRFGFVAGASSRVHLGSPLGFDEEGTVVDWFFDGGPASAAGHVTGGHRDQVGSCVEVGEGAGDPYRAEQVDLDGLVEGGVEAHHGGRVDEKVASGERGPPLVVQSEPFGGDITGHWRDPSGGHLGEAVGTQSVAQ